MEHPEGAADGFEVMGAKEGLREGLEVDGFADGDVLVGESVGR